MSGHPCHVKKVSLTRAGCFWECKNAEFVWELRTMVFCESGRKQSCPLMRVSVSRASTVFQAAKALANLKKSRARSTAFESCAMFQLHS